MDIEEIIANLSSEIIPKVSESNIREFLANNPDIRDEVSEHFDLISYYESKEGQKDLEHHIPKIREQNVETYRSSKLKLEELVSSLDDKSIDKKVCKDNEQIRNLVYENILEDMMVLDVVSNSKSKVASINAIYKLSNEDIHSWVSRIESVLPRKLKDYRIEVERPRISKLFRDKQVKINDVVSSINTKMGFEVNFKDAYYIKDEGSLVVFYDGDDPSQEFLDIFNSATEYDSIIFKQFSNRYDILKSIDSNIRGKQHILKSTENEIKRTIGAKRYLPTGDLGLVPFKSKESLGRDCESYAKITGFGGCEQVGRSSIFAEISGNNMLFDFGLSFSSDSREAIPSIPLDKLANVEYLFLSHAHLDHSGYIPALAKRGFGHIKVVCTEPTYILCEHLWKDNIKIRRDSKSDLLYDESDVEKVREQIYIANYDEEFRLDNDVKVKFLNSGHILGSSMILVEDGCERTLYTGDISLEGTGLLKPADIQTNITNLIIESTYGKSQIISKEEVSKAFKEEVSYTLKENGTVLIPCFSIGRSQEIMNILKDMHEFRNGYTIYLDGCIPKINQITDYYMIRDGNRMGIKSSASQVYGTSILKDEEMSVEEISSYSTRKIIQESKDPKVILTTSGMVEGIAKQHMQCFRKDSRNKMILVGYQAKNTTGAKLLYNDDKIERGKMFGAPFDMQVKYMPLSGHADLESMVDAVSKIHSLKNLFLVHGEGDNINSLYKHYNTTLACRVEKLKLGKEEVLY